MKHLTVSLVSLFFIQTTFSMELDVRLFYRDACSDMRNGEEIQFLVEFEKGFGHVHPVMHVRNGGKPAYGMQINVHTQEDRWYSIYPVSQKIEEKRLPVNLHPGRDHLYKVVLAWRDVDKKELQYVIRHADEYYKGTITLNVRKYRGHTFKDGAFLILCIDLKE